jgi:hypothetical protein
MVLATIIRLEMAYPGVGILAGDSLQYLSVVTAHAVIMVFFMIMPLLFGAFGNFLLPTQLGVHDVAFPRLNSVAFWFLPGGLLMLCQLVCLDRRYQRMNCFNIREIQTLLKARFYADLLNESHQHLFLSRTAPNIRFKLQDLNFFNSCSLLLNKYGVFNSANPRFEVYKDPASALKNKDNLFNLNFSSEPTSNYFNLTNLVTPQLTNPLTLKNTLLLGSTPDRSLVFIQESAKNLFATLSILVEWSKTILGGKPWVGPTESNPLMIYFRYFFFILWRFCGEPFIVLYKIVLSGNWLSFTPQPSSLGTANPLLKNDFKGQSFTSWSSSQIVSLTDALTAVVLPYVKGLYGAQIFLTSIFSLEYNFFI